jgi:hypothetical protein
MGANTDEIALVKKQRKALISITAALLVAATPGIYSAWQTAQQEWKQKLKTEQVVRDRQEHDLQRYVKANKQELDSLRGETKELRREIGEVRSQLISIALLLGRRTGGSPVVSDTVRRLTLPKPPAAEPTGVAPPRPALKRAPWLRQMRQNAGAGK